MRDCIKQPYAYLSLVKGNGRTYDFSDIVNFCHEAETELKHFIDGTKKAEQIGDLKIKIEYIAQLLKDYNDLFHTIFPTNLQNIDLQVVADQTEPRYRAEKDKDPAKRISTLDWFIEKYRSMAAKSLDQILTNQISATKKIAKEIGLLVPSIEVQSNGVEILKTVSLSHSRYL